MLSRINFPAGMDRRSTSYQSEGKWYRGQWVRFIAGLAETIGGWVKFTDETYEGVCRGLFVWRINDNQTDPRYVAIGTNTNLYVVNLGHIQDITPIRATETLTDPFTTVDGSDMVTVDDTAHGALDGDTVLFSGADPVGGITIDGAYIINNSTANSYTIMAESAATSSDTGGGTVTADYLINVGYVDTAFAYGYGVGAYGIGTWGTPRSSSTITISARTWDLASWGENLVACYRYGDIYEWVSGDARAHIIAEAPELNQGIFVTPEFHLVAIGADNQPMQVAWSNQGDNTDWEPRADNQAGDYNLIGGNQLLNAIPLRAGLSLIWSDTDVFAMTYEGQEPWFTFNKQGSGAGIIGPSAAVEYQGVAYWMGQEDFFYFDGFPRPLPADPVRSYVFGDFNAQQRDKVFAGVNKAYGEIWFFYCSAMSNEIDRYVVFNIRDSSWHFGSLTRTAWVDRSLFLNPLATDTNKHLYAHEEGDDGDGDIIEKTIESAAFDIGDGDNQMDIFGVVPDFDEINGTVTITMLTRDYPNDPATVEGPFNVDGTSQRIDTRAAGRQLSLKYASNQLGGRFRMGGVRYDIQPAGRRR
jgi:hypothetical protein